MELDWLTGFALNGFGGGRCVVSIVNASGVGMLSLAQELLVNKGAGLRLKFRVFVIVVTGIV